MYIIDIILYLIRTNIQRCFFLQAIVIDKIIKNILLDTFKYRITSTYHAPKKK